MFPAGGAGAGAVISVTGQMIGSRLILPFFWFLAFILRVSLGLYLSAEELAHEEAETFTEQENHGACADHDPITA